MLKLYHAIISVCAQKVRVLLAEKGLAYDEQVMSLRGDQFEPAYLALNPSAVVPTLVHDGRAVVESNVILRYLDDAFPDPAFMPPDAAGRARIDRFHRLLDDHVHSACSVLTFALAFRPAMRAIDALEREALLSPHPNRDKADKKRDVTEHGLESKYAAEALAHYDSLLAEMEAALGRAPFLAGEEPSLADIAVIPYVIRLDMLRLAPLWAERPKLADWYRRMNARPSVQKEIWRRFSQCDIAAFAAFQPEPWPRVREILAAG